MNYSDNIKYIITADDRNGALGYTNRYIGLYFNSEGEVCDFSVFYTVDGYLDSHDVYVCEEDARKDLDILKNKYYNTGNKRYDSLKNLRVKSIIAIKSDV